MRDMRELTYAEAVNAALVRALESWPETLLFGEDVALPGGVFGVTKGLHSRFGDRVFDTPISESAILGGALGASMVGRRPIAEIMWSDFTLVALDQLVNQAANVRYINRGRLTAPLTVRMQQGNAPGACAQHSQNLEAVFAHIPGLQVCMPAVAQDAYDLLLAAIKSNDPTIVIENRTLYHGERHQVAVGGDIQPVGGAAVRRDGSDLTIVTWGSMQLRALDAAEQLAAAGIQAAVVDLRWIRPWDYAAVIDSVRRTGRLVVVHEAHVSGGFGAEVVARVAECAVEMRMPPVRIGALDARIPAAPTLAAAVIPTTQRIVAEIQRAMESTDRATLAGGAR